MAFDPDAYLNEGKNTSSFDPDAYLGIKPPELSFKDKLQQAAIDSVKHIASGSMEGAKQIATMSPQVQRITANSLPVVGGAALTPLGLGGPGAAAGEFAREAVNTVINPQDVPKTPLGRFASTAGAGLLQDPKILNAIPGASNISEMASNLASKTWKGLAKGAQAFSGGKAGDFMEAAKKGLSTYGAPSKQEAGQMMADALKKLPGASVVPTTAETMESAITPEASAGSRYLMDVAKRIDDGELIDARQALKAKQALDDVIDTVPKQQVKRLGKLFDLKKTFDDVLSNQSGELKDASNAYRAAVLKDNMTKFLPVNKSGEYSRLAPMLSSIAGTAKGLVTSPLLFGGLAAAGGSTARGLGKLGEDPAIRQALLQVLQRLQQNSNAGQANQ